MIVFNRKSIFAFSVFMLSPVAGIMVALHNAKKSQFNFIYFLISLFFAVVFLKNPPLDDLYRYLEMYDHLNPNIIFNEFNNYSVFFAISYFFKMIGVPFYLMVSFFNFLIIFFAL